MDGGFDYDLFGRIDGSNPSPNDMRGLLFRDEEATTARIDALARQRRTAVLMEPFNDIGSRLRAVYTGEGLVQVDVDYLMIEFLDFLSERMVAATTVPQEDIVSALYRTVMDASEGLDEARARTLVVRMIDLMANREGRLKPFSVKYYCPRERKALVRNLRYLTHEETTGGWRLTEDGMRVTLRALDIEEDAGGMNHFLLERAIKRKNISEIIARVHGTRRDCRHYSALIRARIRDVLMGLSDSWADLEKDLDEASNLIAERSESTLSILAGITALMEDGDLPKGHIAQLREAIFALEEVSNAYSDLNVHIGRAHSDYAEAQIAGIGRGISSLMPDLHREILLPFLAVPTAHANGFVEALGESLSRPRRNGHVLDLCRLLDDMSAIVDRLSEQAEEAEVGELEDLTADDVMSVEEQVMVHQTVAAIIAERAPIALSDLCALVLEADGITPRQKSAMVLAAMSTSDDTYIVEPLPTTFRIEGAIEGSDVLLRLAP